MNLYFKIFRKSMSPSPISNNLLLSLNVLSVYTARLLMLVFFLVVAINTDIHNRFGHFNKFGPLNKICVKLHNIALFINLPTNSQHNRDLLRSTHKGPYHWIVIIYDNAIRYLLYIVYNQYMVSSLNSMPALYIYITTSNSCVFSCSGYEL